MEKHSLDDFVESVYNVISGQLCGILGYCSMAEIRDFMDMVDCFHSLHGMLEGAGFCFGAVDQCCAHQF